MAEAWLMLAFPKDYDVLNPELGFKPSQSGKSWWKTTTTREDAIKLKYALIDAGIGYKCHKVPAETSGRDARARQYQGKPYKRTRSQFAKNNHISYME